MKLPYFKQETDYTCGAATARMMINGLLDINESENFFAQLLNTNDQVGTLREAFNALHTLNHELECKTGINGDMTMLTHLQQTGYVVALLYMLHDGDDAPVGHWGVFKSIDNKKITLLDPWMGPNYSLPLSVFMSRWYSDPALCNGVKDPMPWVAIRKKASTIC